jgi:hypothetical protein
MKPTTAILISTALVGCAGSSSTVMQRHDGTTKEYIASSDDAWAVAKDYLRKISNDGHIVEDKSASFMSVRVSRSVLERVGSNPYAGSLTTEVWIEPGSRQDTVYITFVQTDGADQTSAHRDFRNALQRKLGGRNVIPTPSRQ